MNQKAEEQELNNFQLRNIRILTHLFQNDAITDEIVDDLRESELEYFSLYGKYQLLEEQVNIDEKTKLLKFKQDYLTNIIKTASRIYFGMKSVNYHISLIRFDIDDFSKFNNTYGHDIGDVVLKKIADVIRSHSRPTDYVIRFGGEEFDVILPSTAPEGAAVYLDKIFKCIRQERIMVGGQEKKITVSAGFTHISYQFADRMVDERKTQDIFQQMQREADDALYESKYLGKDRYSFFQPEKIDTYKDYRRKYKK